jgi:hypothetical protein
MPGLPTIEFDAEDDFTCELAIALVYEKIEGARGEEVAHRMFGHELPRRRLAAIKNVQLLLKFLAMPEPNKQRLAVELARKNEALPRAQRHGPRGSTDPVAMLKQIDRVLKQPAYLHWAKAILSAP